ANQLAVNQRLQLEVTIGAARARGRCASARGQGSVGGSQDVSRVCDNNYIPRQNYEETLVNRAGCGSARVRSVGRHEGGAGEALESHRRFYDGGGREDAG